MRFKALGPDGKLTRNYRKFASMKARCYSPSHPARKYYAEKGIIVCERWRGKDGFQNFMADMGEPPDGLTLERINNAGNYEPTNCRWATWKEQANNRDRNGKHPDPNSMRQKAIKANLPYHVVYQRIVSHGWPEDEALTTPVGPSGRKVGWQERYRQQQNNKPYIKPTLINTARFKPGFIPAPWQLKRKKVPEKSQVFFQK